MNASFFRSLCKKPFAASACPTLSRSTNRHAPALIALALARRVAVQLLFLGGIFVLSQNAFGEIRSGSVSVTVNGLVSRPNPDQEVYDVTVVWSYTFRSTLAAGVTGSFYPPSFNREFIYLLPRQIWVIGQPAIRYLESMICPTSL